MRHLAVLALLVGSATPVFADSRGLEARDVQNQLKPIGDTIEHCYIDRTADVRGAGHLDLVLTVSRFGILEKLDIKTPGIAAKVAKQIDTCIRAAVAPIAFPVKKTFTTVTVPYFFQRTDAPSSGPQESCWDPKGCHVDHPERGGANSAASLPVNGRRQTSRSIANHS